MVAHPNPCHSLPPSLQGPHGAGGRAGRARCPRGMAKRGAALGKWWALGAAGWPHGGSRCQMDRARPGERTWPRRCGQSLARHTEARPSRFGNARGAPCANNVIETELRRKEGKRRKGKESTDCLLLPPRPRGLRAPPLTKQKSNKITEIGQEHLPNKLPKQEQEEERGAARSPTCNLRASALSPHESRARPRAPGSAPAREGETAKKMGSALKKKNKYKNTKRRTKGDVPHISVTHPLLSPGTLSAGKALNCNNNNKLIILPPPIALFI